MTDNNVKTRNLKSIRGFTEFSFEHFQEMQLHKLKSYDLTII